MQHKINFVNKVTNDCIDMQDNQLFLDFGQEKLPLKQLLRQTHEAPAAWAFLYTATATGSNSGIHFMMTTDDAKKWCSSPRSHGVYMGTEWAYFYTTVENFAFCHWGGNHSTNPESGCVDLRKCSDNNKWDEEIKKVGCRKYGKAEIQKILEPMGIKVLI